MTTRKKSFSRAPRVSYLRGWKKLPLAVMATLVGSTFAQGQTYTNATTTAGIFTNIANWNFGAGPIPVSGPSTSLTIQNLGLTAITAQNDLNLTLNALTLNNYSGSTMTLSNTLGGNYAFTGTATVNQAGSGGATTISAPVALSTSLASLTFGGAGPGNLTVSGVISANDATKGITIAGTAANPVTGVVALGGANTFTGGVALNSGTLELQAAASLGAFGSTFGTLTVNGGMLRGSTTATILNNIVLNADLNYNTTSANSPLFAGSISGAGGVRVSGSGGVVTPTLQFFAGNSYAGATTIGGLNLPNGSGGDGPTTLRILGAVGAISSTAGINVRDGGNFEINLAGGNSVNTTRVPTSNAITMQSGFLQVIGNAGVTSQNFGTTTASGLATVLANTTGAVGSSTSVTIANLVRSGNATFVFSGANLGGAAAGPTVNQGNIFATLLNGAAVNTALAPFIGGGGGPGTTTINILPWALGENANTGSNYSAGSGFVTYDSNGFRLLNAATEYRTDNNVTAGTNENYRVSASHALTGNATVNSMYFGTTGATISGSNTLTISSGALSSNVVASTISAPIFFGSGGAGEAVIGTISSLATPNTITLSGGFTAGSLTKFGSGILSITTVNPTIAGGITVNGGFLAIDDVARVGGATGITFNNLTSNNRGGLTFSPGATQTLATPINIIGGRAQINVSNAAGVLTLSGNITGAGGINPNGNATAQLLLRGTNTYTGGTRVGPGILDIDDDTRLGAAPTLALPLQGFLNFNTGTLRLSGNWNTARAINFESTGTNVFNTQAFNSTWSGPITSAGASPPVTKIGSGAWTITGADNGYTGTITLGDAATQGGLLALTGSGQLSSASVVFGPAGAGVAGTYSLDISGITGLGPVAPGRAFAGVSTGSATLFAQAHTIQLGTSGGAGARNILIGGGSAGITFGSTGGGGVGQIVGFGNVYKVGGNALSFVNPNGNTFTGNVEVWGGSLFLTSDNQLGAATNGVVLQGGTFGTTGTPAADITFPAARAFTVNNGQLSLLAPRSNVLNAQSATGDLIIQGNIGGTGGFEITSAGGGGSVTLSGTNTYGGDIRLTTASSTLLFTNNSNLGAASSRVILNGGALQSTANATIDRTLPVTAASFIESAAATTLQLDGPMLGSLGVTKRQTGNLIINSANPLFVGTFTIGGGAASGNVSMSNAGTFPRATVSLAAASASTLDLSNSIAAPLTREFGALGATFAIGNTINLGSTNPLTVVTGFNNAVHTWAGAVTGSQGSITKLGTGSVTITNTVGNGGALTILFGATTVNGAAVAGPPASTGGIITLKSSFTIGGWADQNNAGTTFLLGDTTSPLIDRIANAQDIYINNSGFAFTTNTTTFTTETANSLRGNGFVPVTMTTGGALGFTSATDGLTRVSRGTFLFRNGGGSLIGTATATATLANVTFGNLPGTQLLGGGGGAGTPQISILPYATGGDTAGSTGNTFVTYGAFGIRTLQSPSEYNATLIGAGATDNVRVSNAVLTTLSLPANQTVNSLIITGTASTTRIDGAFNLVVDSGAILSPVNNVYTAPNAFTAVQLGIQSAGLQTGLADTRELILHTNNGDLQVGALISTSGGLTKSGLSNLFLTRPGGNTYTGGTTVNSGMLVIDSLAAIGDSPTQQLTLSGGYFKYRGSNATLAGPLVAGANLAGGGSATNVAGAAGIHVASGTTLSINSAITGFGGLSKEGTGVLSLAGTNTYSGDTFIQAGTLSVNSAAALGNGSRVLFLASSTSAVTSGGVLRFANSAPMTVTQDFSTFTGSVTVGYNFETTSAANPVTLSGLIGANVGTRGLTKLGVGDLILTAANNYTGATNVFGGNLVLAGANGSILGSNGSGGYSTAASILVGPTGTLVLDNTAVNNNNRLPDVFSIPLGTGDSATAQGIGLRGGEFRIRGNSTTATSEAINRFEHGVGTVTLENNGQNVTLTSGRYFRNFSLTPGLIRGTNLGSPVAANTTNWFVRDQGSGGVQLAGAGGAAGTPFININPGVIGDTSAIGDGSGLLTYDSAVGFRLLASAEYSATIPTLNFDGSRAPNISLSGATVAPSSTSWISALRLGGGASLTGSGTVNVMQSTILATGNSAISVSVLSDNGTGSNGSYVFHTAGAATTLTVNSAMNSGGLVKYGLGTLEMTNAYYNPVNLLVGQGTLRLVGANAFLPPVAAPLIVLAGGTFDLGDSDRTISSITQLAGAVVGSFQLGQALEGTIALGSNKLTLMDSAVTGFSGQFIGTAASELIKSTFSTGTFSIFQPQTGFNGTVRLLGGTLSLGGLGSFPNIAALDPRAGNLTLNNANELAGSGGGYIAQRIPATAPINLAGTITVTSNADAVSVHNFGATSLVGQATLAVTAGAAAPTTLNFAAINRATNKGTLILTGTNLGIPLAPNGGVNVFATQVDGLSPTDPAVLLGAAGAAGTTTTSIYPWANSGSTFYTYGANGFRPLDTTAEYNASITAGSTVNVRTVASATLAGATTVNSLFQVTTGGVAGAFDLTIDSGALASSVTGTIGVNTNSLLTGAGNTRELVVFNSAAVTIAYNISTTGGITKFGSGALTLSGNNTYTGDLSIGGTTAASVSFASAANLGNPTRIVFGIPGLTTTGSLTYTGTTPITLAQPIVTNSFGSISAPANQIVVLNGTISGQGSFNYSGSGAIYEVNGVNTYTGATNHNFGFVSILNDSGLGDGGAYIITNGTAQGIIQRGDWTTSRPIHASNFGIVINSAGFNTSWNGQLFGTTTIVKTGLGALNITSPAPYSGSFSLNAGDIRLRDRGALAATGTQTLGFGTRFILDDTGVHFSDRIQDVTSLLSGNNSELMLLGNGSVTTEEVINSLTLGLASTVTVQAGSGQAAILRLGQAGVLTSSSNSSILFRGTNLGVNAPGTANTASIMVFNPAASLTTGRFVGGSGPAGSTALNIIAGAFGDISATGTGTQLVTYDFTNGIRLLNASEYAATLDNGTVRSDNIRLNGGTTAIANNSTINALWMDNGAALNIATGANLTITAGNILVSGTGNAINGTGTGSILEGTSATLAVGGPGALTINAVIATAAGGIVKTGSGTLTLALANTFTGTTTVSSGTIVANNAGSFGAAANTVRFLGGTLQAGAAGLTIANPIGLSGDLAFAGSNDLSVTNVTLESGTRAIDVAVGRTLTVAGTITNQIHASGLTKNGGGVLILTGNSAATYAPTASANFYLSTTTVNQGELRVNNTAGSGTGGSIVVVNTGGTLSGTGTILPTQSLQARNIVSVNSGGTISPGASVGTLTIGATTTPGVTTATVVMNAGSNYRFEYTGAQTTAAANTGGSSTPGTGHDTLAVNGVLNVAPGTQNFIPGNFGIVFGPGDFNDFTPGSPYSFRIGTQTANYANTTSYVPTVNTAALTNFTGFSSITIETVAGGNGVFLNFQPVPEPASLLLVGGGLAGLAGWVRRRRNA